MPGSVINQPERLKRLESPFSLFLCGVAAGRCSSYLDSLATDATLGAAVANNALLLFLFLSFLPIFFPLHSTFLCFFLFFFCVPRERERKREGRFAEKISIFRSGRRLESTTKAPMGEQRFILRLRQPYPRLGAFMRFCLFASGGFV